MLQYASVEDVFSAQPTNEPRGHRRRSKRKDDGGNDQPPPNDVQLSTVTPKQESRHFESTAYPLISAEFMRMLPYGALLTCILLIGLLFDIRNSLIKINNLLPQLVGRYARYV